MQTPNTTSAQTFEVIKLALAVVGFVLGLISIILVYVQMRKTHEWNRRKASHDALSELATGNVDQFRRALRVIFGVELGTSQRYTDIEAKVRDEDRRVLRHNTSQYLNYLEVMCVGMKNHVLDEDICYDYAKGALTNFWRWAEPLIHAERKVTGSDTIWIEVEKYAKRWSKREEREREQLIERLGVPGKPRT